MQLCVVIAVIASLAAADLAPDRDVAFAAPKFVAVVLAQLVVVLAAWAVSLQTTAEVACEGLPRKEVARRLEQRSRWYLGMWLVASLCILTCFDWPCMVNTWQFTGSTIWQPLVLLLPILTPLLCSWAVLYRAELALDESVEQQTCWQYVLAQVRYYVLVPLVPILIVMTWVNVCDRLWPGDTASGTAFLLRAIPLLVLAIAFPLLLRVLWRTTSMDLGPLRRRLEARCKQFSFQSRDILVWHTEHRLFNAAVAGLLPQIRYVLLTDRLIRDLSPKHVECVFLHEIAHGKLHHSCKLTLALCGGLGVGCMSAVTIVRELTESASELTVVPSHLLSLASVILVCLLLVGRYARLLELQADLWAASQVRDHITYLRAIASVASGHPDDTTWLHPSFEQRCQFLINGIELGAICLRNRLALAIVHLVVWPSTLAVVAVCLRSM